MKPNQNWTDKKPTEPGEYKYFLFSNFGIFHTNLAKCLAVESILDEGICGKQQTKGKE